MNRDQKLGLAGKQKDEVLTFFFFFFSFDLFVVNVSLFHKEREVKAPSAAGTSWKSVACAARETDTRSRRGGQTSEEGDIARVPKGPESTEHIWCHSEIRANRTEGWDFEDLPTGTR